MQNPYNLFLLDGLGAVVSALSLGALLPYFNEYIGMPRETLRYLAMPAVAFAVYSLACYFIRPVKWRPWMHRIAVANLLYCCLTIFLMFLHFRDLTGWGLAYFVAEVVVIFVLVYWEFRTAGSWPDATV